MTGSTQPERRVDEKMKKPLTLALVLLMALTTLLSSITVPVSAQPTIDGVLSTGEWDAYYLGTSVTGWAGGMSVAVYGFADASFLYAAYVADKTQPGWAVACALNINANLYYKTPQSASWPDKGYTIFEMDPSDYMQTDATDWVLIGPLSTILGLEQAYVNMYSVDDNDCAAGLTNNNIAEFKIPLSVITYAGNDGKIALDGQYWQYDFAQSFYVTLPPIEVNIDIKPGSFPNAINPRSKGVIPVAILGSATFDVTTVDVTSLKFGHNGATPVHYALEDVNGDNFMDLILQFKTQATGIKAGDSQACLTGALLSGTPIEGCDSIITVPR